MMRRFGCALFVLIAQAFILFLLTLLNLATLTALSDRSLSNLLRLDPFVVGWVLPVALATGGWLTVGFATRRRWLAFLGWAVWLLVAICARSFFTHVLPDWFELWESRKISSIEMYADILGDVEMLLPFMLLSMIGIPFGRVILSAWRVHVQTHMSRRRRKLRRIRGFVS